jgi:RNA 2',3'-cyclic 3'-phosphodiesterase
MTRIRTFIGIDIGKAIRDRAVALQDFLAQAGTDVKWVEPENIHVTLLFLGEVDDREIPSVCRVVGETVSGHQPFSMVIERVGCFPNPRRPRILWIGVGEGTQELCALHDGLEPPLMSLGCYRREERKYTPHITLGRVRSNGTVERLAAALGAKAVWRGGEIDVREILVMGSQLTPQGPIYSVLSRAKLGR